jgi:hypothetical protein
VINKHIYFQDEEGMQDDKGEDPEEKTNEGIQEDIQDDNGEEEKINDVKSEDTHDITLKREGDQFIDAPSCKKSLVTEM